MISLLDRLLKCTGCVAASLALFAMMWLMLADVLGRKFFNHSLPGALELTEILMVVVVFGALPLVSWRSEHIIFDSFDRFIPPALKALQQRLVHLVCAGTFIFISYQMIKRAERFAEYGEVTSYLALPLAPVAWIMVMFLALTALVHLVFVVMPPPEIPEGEAHFAGLTQ